MLATLACSLRSISRIAGKPLFPALTPVLLFLLLMPDVSAQEISVPLYQKTSPVSAQFFTSWQWEQGSVFPVAIDMHPGGILVGIESRRHQLFLATADGEWIGYGDAGGREFGFADRLFARSGLQIYTLNSDDRVVDTYDLQGDWEGRLDLEASVEASGEFLTDPVDFCLDQAGDLYLLDGSDGRIFVFNRAGTLLSIFGDWGQLASAEPEAIEVDGQGRLHLLTQNPPGIMVLDVGGREIAWKRFPDHVTPVELSVDRWGNGYIIDSTSKQIRVIPFGSDGISFSIAAPEGVEFDFDALVVDNENRLLIADERHGKIWVYHLQFAEGTGSNATGTTR
jgi:hypothetical protein